MKRKILPLLLLIISASAAGAADIFVPSLELVTRMYIEDSLFKLQTSGSLEMSIEGGYKFGGRIGIGIENAVLEDINNPPALTLRTAEVSVKEMFGSPVNFSYFTGIVDNFCSGDIFHRYFGSGYIRPHLSGFKAFSEAGATVYEGLHRVAGTGVSVSSAFLTDWNHSALYIYQDASLGSGIYSADIRSAFSFGDFKLEGFAGGSFPVSTAGIYRGGFLIYFRAGETGSFLAQIGIPRWDPVQDPFSINLFYFLFEPRLNFGMFGINLSFFWHPYYYRNMATGEGGSVDLLLNFAVGNLEEFPLSGGLDARLTYNASAASDQFKTVVSPYMSLITSGVLWDFKLNVKVLPFDLATMFEGCIGVTAEF